MTLEENAFINLAALARVDGKLADEELALLARYREALGLSEDFVRKTLEEDSLGLLGPEAFKGKPGDRLQILKMMVRVAYADGTVTKQEKRLLSRTMRSLGIGRIAFRGLCWEVEREMGLRKKLRTSQIVALATVAAAALIIGMILQHFSSRTDERLDETSINLDLLKNKLGLEQNQAEAALREVRRSQAELAQSESDLMQRLKQLEQQGLTEQDALAVLTSEQRERQTALQEEITRLRSDLSRNRSINTVFKEIEKQYNHSILLIFTTYDLVMDKERITQGSMGTGFFVSSSGHIVTNKHVVQPWKFTMDDRLLMDLGFTLDPASLITAAWPAGGQVKTPEGRLNIDAAFSTRANTLMLHQATPDTLVTQVRQVATGGTYEGELHSYNEGDLAVLKVSSPTTVRPLPLRVALEKVEKLDPVMVLGYPTGINILESTVAETSPSLGEVRKIELSIMVTAPIFPGNSGGPLIGLDGRVTGVASGIFGDATLGSCIPCKYILPLLPETADLLQAAGRYLADRDYRAALDELRLAEQRCENDSERTAVEEARTNLCDIRDQMLAEARLVGDTEARTNAYQEILERFGPHWGRAAVEYLKER